MATVLSRPQRGDLYQQGSRLPHVGADKRGGNIPETEQNYRVSERNAAANKRAHTAGCECITHTYIIPS